MAGPSADKPTLTGYLMLKGVSNTIEFPITVIEGKDVTTIKAAFTLDRTKWGINYQSGSIFGTLKDDAISDIIDVTLNLAFKKP